MRLLVRIWLHGVLLFVALVAVIFTARFVLPDTLTVMHQRPALASGVAHQALADRDDPGALGRLAAETSMQLTLYDASGRVLASSVEPPLSAAPPARPEERRGSGTVVAGEFRGGVLAAYAVAVTPPIPSLPLHVTALVLGALGLAFVFVALPIAWSIGRPIKRLSALARELGRGNLDVRADLRRRDEIGELAAAFDDMARQLKALRTAERQLLGDVSHELRTPLARMRVVLELAGDADPERVRRYLREITSDLGELEQLVDDIIEDARWDSAQPPLRRTTLDLAELVATSASRFRARWPGRELEIDYGAGETVVAADPVLLRRALDNLIDNARKYSPDDRAIRARVIRDGDAARVEVIDEGVGIAEEDRARLFTPFFRADPSRSRATGGVGLGLALTRRIVEAHGGTIGCTSEVARGSRFWFALPLGGDPR